MSISSSPRSELLCVSTPKSLLELTVHVRVLAITLGQTPRVCLYLRDAIGSNLEHSYGWFERRDPCLVEYRVPSSLISGWEAEVGTLLGVGLGSGPLSR